MLFHSCFPFNVINCMTEFICRLVAVGLARKSLHIQTGVRLYSNLPKLPLWLTEDVRTFLHSTVDMLSLVLQGWRSCSVLRLSPFLNDQIVHFGTIHPLLCSKNSLKGNSPCPFCFLSKLGSRDVPSAGLYFLGDQLLQLSAARDKLLFFNV